MKTINEEIVEWAKKYVPIFSQTLNSSLISVIQ